MEEALATSRPPAAAVRAGPAAGARSLAPAPGQPKRAGLLARQLEEEIARAGCPAGALLGTENELLARLGVGRSVLREAARILEDLQVARMRRGRGGGLVVLEPDGQAVTEAVSIYLESTGVGLDDIFEARQVIDTVAVELAADRVDERHLSHLRQLLEAERRADAAALRAGSHRRIHAAIAQATGNPAIALFAETLAQLADDGDAMAGRLTGPASWRGVAAVHRAHEAIVEAVISGDGPRAAQRMAEHLSALHDEVVRRSSRPAPAVGAPTAAGLPAISLARRIRRDIAQLGWPAGHNLGSEPELLQRYATGRSRLREAIRILEHHAAVEMRRGPRGGLVVRAPDGSAAVAAVARHLEYRGIGAVELFEARDALEMATLRLAIERLDQEGTHRLEAALRHPANLPSREFSHTAHDFHVVIASLSGNRTMELFVRILTHLTAIRLIPADERFDEPSDDGTEARSATSGYRPQVDHAHRRIAAAIFDGDTALARRRMRIHLRALECSTL